MRITKIEIKNFKAFQGSNVIDLNGPIELSEKGQNLLLYGENGSGKTSLYKALELFLDSSASSENDSINFTEYKNFPAIDNGDDGYVRLHFTPDPNLQKTTYEWSDSEAALNDTKVQPIIDASKAKGFLDYKALLHTHYLHYEKDTVDVFKLLIDTLLKNVINELSDTQRSFAEEWHDISAIVLPEQSTEQYNEIQQQLETFNSGIKNILTQLKVDANKMLRKFEYKNTVDDLAFTYQAPKINNDSNKYDPPQILLKIDFCGTTRPKYHQFLNEAKLSAIALSIFFAGFKNQPDSALKLLVLDDALIGLDMSNRLPVLDILDDEPFKNYQIFLMTYDRAFYEIVKQRKFRDKQWKIAELYYKKIDGYEIPVYAEEEKYIDKAKEYLKANDYKACAIYVRTAFEATMKRFCEPNKVRVRYHENPKNLTSWDFWIPMTRWQRNGTNVIDQTLKNKIESVQKFVLNELSHASVANIYKKELEVAIEAVEELESLLA